MTNFTTLPILDLSLSLATSPSPSTRATLLQQLHSSLFTTGFLYLTNHSIPQPTIDALVSRLPALFDLPLEEKRRLSKLNSPHFLGWSAFGGETTLGKRDLREQFDFGSEVPSLPLSAGGGKEGEGEGEEQGGWEGEGDGRGQGLGDGMVRGGRREYWRLRGPNQWPPEELVPGFREAFMNYHDALQELSYRFVLLVEEAFGIPVGTFDQFFRASAPDDINGAGGDEHATGQRGSQNRKGYLQPQHRVKLLKYPATPPGTTGQGVGPHTDSSGWLTFLYQLPGQEGLEVVNSKGEWIAAPPIEGTFVVNFGNAFEAATEGAVKATVHRVVAPQPGSPTRYSIPFFQGLPLDMTVTEIRSYIPESVRRLRKERDPQAPQVSTFLDPRWDCLGESQLRKWIRSHEDVGRKWYGDECVEYYLQ